MDEHSKKSLQALAPDFSLSRLEGLFPYASSSEWGDLKRSEYLAARAEGLSIAQAQFAVKIAEELRHNEIEGFVTRLATPQQIGGRSIFKRRGKPLKEEPDHKKKPKF
mmetsp:Transcript_6840/g.12387  ORF Transcript_6840/g.12387 Transcript_6840/m.12387 type:complete len:108 (-) Transcript_6840:823-1146(-)